MKQRRAKFLIMKPGIPPLKTGKNCRENVDCLKNNLNYKKEAVNECENIQAGGGCGSGQGRFGVVHGIWLGFCATG
jgi:hypothetical protein